MAERRGEVADETSVPDAAGDLPDDAFSPAYANYVLGLLFVVYVFNFLDRQILNILLDPVKADLGVSDSAMGFLTGFAFALFYTVAGLPIARWADRGTRRTIIALGLAVWSAMTALSGLARNFAQLAIARVGVGVGEAACSPPAHSLISDYFPAHRRATALSLYNAGIYVGGMLGLLVGGWINQLFSWRTAFVVVGLPGIALALVVRLTVREPRRGRMEAVPVDTKTSDLREVVRFLGRKKSFMLAGVACGFAALTAYGLAVWTPAFLGRIHDMGSGAIGTWLGLINGVAGGSGAIAGGMVADRLARRDERWYLWIPGIGTVLSVPLALFFLFANDVRIALLSYFAATFFAAGFLAPSLAALYKLVKVRMRALASALLFFVLNLIGLGCGPQLVGILNDVLAASQGVEAIRYSLTIVTLIGLLGGALFFVAALWFLNEREILSP